MNFVTYVPAFWFQENAVQNQQALVALVQTWEQSFLSFTGQQELGNLGSEETHLFSISVSPAEFEFCLQIITQ